MNEGQPVANFVPTILAKYSPENPEEPLRLLLGVQLGATRKTLVWLADQLDRLNFERELPGCICRDQRGRSTKSLLASYIRMQLGETDLPNGIYIARTGWSLIDGEHKFVIGDTASQVTAGQYASCSPPANLMDGDAVNLRFAVDQTLTADAATEALLRAMIAHPDVYLPVWGYSLFAVMRSFLKDSGLPTACILYLIAPQGFGKTTVAKRLCQLFDDNSGMMADVYDAGSSVAAMRNVLMQARDRPILFDDVFIGTNKTKQRERRDNAAVLLRFAANETPLTKMHGKHETSVTCAASLIVTGEIPFEARSDVTRCVIVRIAHQLTGDTDKLRAVAATAMRGFLTWFGAHYATARLQIQRDFDGFIAEYRTKNEPRVQKSLFELHWLLGSFFDYAQEIGAIAASARQQLIAAAERALTQVWENIQRELRRIENRPPTLAEAIAVGIRSGTLPAFQHRGCACVRTENLTNYLQQLYRRSDLSDSCVTAALRQSNLLALDNTGKSTKKVNGERCLCIPLSCLPLGFTAS